jgi:hypothetical protein
MTHPPYGASAIGTGTALLLVWPFPSCPESPKPQQ